MDIAYFISDLLGQQGNVSVPNLGHFAQVCVPAFYDNQSKQFLPPHYSVQFDPQVSNDDDTLAEYISSVKKISTSSAKYFIEKFTGNLRSQAIVARIDLHNLGTFSSDRAQLVFNPAKNSDDPAFFAYPPIDVYRIGETSRKQTIIKERLAQPATEAFVANASTAPTVAKPEPAERQIIYPPKTAVGPDEPAYENESHGIATWMIVACSVVVLFIILGGLYKFRPELFQQFTSNQPVTENHADPIIKKDTNIIAVQVPLKQDSVANKDTTAIVVDKSVKSATYVASKDNKSPAKSTTIIPSPVASPLVKTPAVTTTTPATDMPEAVTKGTWVIYSQVFPTKHGADMRIKELQHKGFAQARLANTKVGPGGNYKVILGAFKTFAEALDAKKELLATGKLTKDDLSVEKY